MNLPTGKCATTEWLDWSGCSVTCGVGVRTRKRMFLSPEVDEAMCGKRTTEKDNCIGFENECEKPDEDCAVTGWSEWNPCSVTCGKGFKERRRYYLNKMDMKRCNRKMQEMTMCVNTFMDCTNLPVKNFSGMMYGIMTEELVICEIRSRPRRFRFTYDEFRGHYAT